MYKLLFSGSAQKDAAKIKRSNLEEKCRLLLKILSEDPFTMTPPFEKLVGDLKGFYSRRINIQHRLVYVVYERDKVIKILRMWSHYE
jgi:toxin YoeB